MQVGVEEERSSVFTIDLELFHCLDVSSFKVKELKVDHSLQNLCVQWSLLNSLLYDSSDWLLRLLVFLRHIDQILLPPEQPRLADRVLPGDLPRAESLKEQGMHPEVVGLEVLREGLPHYVRVEVELPI